MSKSLAILFSAAFLTCFGAYANDSLPSAKPTATDSIPSAAKTSDALSKSGLSVSMAFELTTPSGSAGKWTSGGGGVLTMAYAHYFNPRFFASAGIAGYYVSTGTDFLPGSTAYTDGSVKNAGIRIPLHLGSEIDILPDLALTFSTGPQVNINLYAHEQLPPDFSNPGSSDVDINLFKEGFKRVDLQWGFWAGFTYMGHYTVGLSGGVGLTPEAKMNFGPRRLSIRRNNVAIVLSYTF